MKLPIRFFISSFLSVILISGCVGQKEVVPVNVESFQEKQEKPFVKKVVPINFESFQEKQEKPFGRKIDNFLVILDLSGSMSNLYKGISKFEFEKKILAGMNETLPDINVKSAIRSFGKTLWTFEKSFMIAYGVADYSKKDFGEALEKIEGGYGNSVLAGAINSAKEDLISLQGETSIIIFSDGVDMNNMPLEAAEEMKKQYGENVCFYTVLIGNDAKGGDFLNNIARIGGSGFFEKGDNLTSQKGMQNFVEKAFFPIRDNDGDGVYNNVDKCPETPKNVKVDSRGCRKIPKNFVLLLKSPDGTTGKIMVSNEKGTRKLERAGYVIGMDDTNEMPESPFELEEKAIHEFFQKTMDAQPERPITFILYFQTNSVKLTKESEEELRKVLPALKKREVPNVEITGHADRAGNEDYNHKLALKRAFAIRGLLVKEGIDTNLIEVDSHGENNPLVDTPDGVREPRNRRVEVIVR